jgi:hypothetical protein
MGLLKKGGGRDGASPRITLAPRQLSRRAEWLSLLGDIIWMSEWIISGLSAMIHNGMGPVKNM